MGLRFELVWRAEDDSERCIPVAGVLSVGRGTRNDVVFADEDISWEHARFWVEGGQLFVDDAASTNGTFVDDERVRRRTELRDGARVRLGSHVSVAVRAMEGVTPSPERCWIVEDVRSGLRRPLRDELRVGSDPGCDLRIPDAAPLRFRLDGGRVLLLRDGGVAEPVRLGQVIEHGGIQLRLLDTTRQTPMRTAQPAWGRGHYHVDATLDGRSPVATIYDDDGRRLVVEGETRATLVYVLAKAVLDARHARLSRDEQGWIEDVDAVTQVWGRTPPSEVSNRLSVVVYRLRAGLKRAGLSSGFIERERGRVRVRAARVSLG